MRFEARELVDSELSIVEAKPRTLTKTLLHANTYSNLSQRCLSSRWVPASAVASLARLLSRRYNMDPETTSSPNYWLLKAEPDSRIVKEKDVKVSELAHRQNAASNGQLISASTTLRRPKPLRGRVSETMRPATS
jgi:hypothetical protein